MSHVLDIAEVISERANTAPTLSIDVSLIDPCPFQPRKNFDPAALQSLARDIEKRKLLYPVWLRIVSPPRLQLIAGERRLRSIRDILQWPKIDSKIFECTDKEAVELCGIENFQRQDLLPSEKACQMQMMRDQDFSIEEIATSLGFTPGDVQNFLRIATLPVEIQNMLDEKQLRMSAVPVIADIQGQSNQLRAARIAVVGKLTQIQLRGRTQHLPRHTPQRARRVSSPVKKPDAVQPFLSQILTLKESAEEFSPGLVSDSTKRRGLSKNLGDLIQTLQTLKASLDR